MLGIELSCHYKSSTHMKGILSVITLTAIAASTFASDDGAQRVSVNDEMRRLLTSEIHFDPKAHDGDPAVKEFGADDVVFMESLTVTESYQQRMMARSIENKRQRLIAEKFTWTRGGTFFDKEIGRFHVKVGSWPQGAFIPLLSIGW